MILDYALPHISEGIINLTMFMAVKRKEGGKMKKTSLVLAMVLWLFALMPTVQTRAEVIRLICGSGGYTIDVNMDNATVSVDWPESNNNCTSRNLKAEITDRYITYHLNCGVWHRLDRQTGLLYWWVNNQWLGQNIGPCVRAGKPVL